jgi:hypothetical protein
MASGGSSGSQSVGVAGTGADAGEARAAGRPGLAGRCDAALPGEGDGTGPGEEATAVAVTLRAIAPGSTGGAR